MSNRTTQNRTGRPADCRSATATILAWTESNARQTLNLGDEHEPLDPAVLSEDRNLEPESRFEEESMGACLSSGMRHPMEKHAVWISYQPSEKGGKFHRPRGATINGAVPLRKVRFRTASRSLGGQRKNRAKASVLIAFLRLTLVLSRAFRA